MSVEIPTYIIGETFNLTECLQRVSKKPNMEKFSDQILSLVREITKYKETIQELVSKHYPRNRKKITVNRTKKGGIGDVETGNLATDDLATFMTKKLTTRCSTFALNKPYLNEKRVTLENLEELSDDVLYFNYVLGKQQDNYVFRFARYEIDDRLIQGFISELKKIQEYNQGIEAVKKNTSQKKKEVTEQIGKISDEYEKLKGRIDEIHDNLESFIRVPDTQLVHLTEEFSIVHEYITDTIEEYNKLHSDAKRKREDMSYLENTMALYNMIRRTPNIQYETFIGCKHLQLISNDIESIFSGVMILKKEKNRALINVYFSPLSGTWWSIIKKGLELTDAQYFGIRKIVGTELIDKGIKLCNLLNTICSMDAFEQFLERKNDLPKFFQKNAFRVVYPVCAYKYLDEDFEHVKEFCTYDIPQMMNQNAAINDTKKKQKLEGGAIFKKNSNSTQKMDLDKKAVLLIRTMRSICPKQLSCLIAKCATTHKHGRRKRSTKTTTKST